MCGVVDAGTRNVAVSTRCFVRAAHVGNYCELLYTYQLCMQINTAAQLINKRSCRCCALSTTVEAGLAEAAVAVKPSYSTAAGASPHSGGGISLTVGMTVRTTVGNGVSSSSSSGGDTIARQQQQQHVQYSARAGT
jgi:hypothetical protein